MKALITGINGFAGTHLCEHLLAQGDALLGCSTSGRWGNDAPVAVRNAAQLFTWDITADLSDAARQQIEQFQPDCIYHLAAISVPHLCGDQEPSDRAMAVNVAGTARVIDLALSLPGSPRLIALSSSHVYAPVDSNEVRVTEDFPLAPQRAYGKTKLAAEQLVRQAIAEKQLNAIIVRAFNHTGPRQRPIAMLPEWCEQLARGVKTIRVKTCDAWLDLSDVREVVQAYRLLAKLRLTRPARTVYNVGSGQPVRSGEVLKCLMALQESQPLVEQTSAGIRYEPIASVSRIYEDAGWQAKKQPEQLVADTWQDWHLR